MARLFTLPQVQALARAAGFSTTPYTGVDEGVELLAPDDRIIAAISMVEGVTDASMARSITERRPYTDQDAVGDTALMTTVWDDSRSFLQIRGLVADRHTRRPRDGFAIRADPGFALSTALGLVKSRRLRGRLGFEDWSTFNTGQYEAYLPDYYPTAPGTYKVIGGDTLSRIAADQKQGTWQDWARVNSIRSPYLIFIGQTLMKLWVEHVVVPGDTLIGIVAHYGDGVTVAQVAAFNSITNVNLIRPDQVIRIPSKAL